MKRISLLLLGVLMYSTSAIAEDPGNTICPVMKGEKIDPTIFVDYEGKKVYLCCNFCKNKFSKDPTAYIGNLKPPIEDESGVSTEPATTQETASAQEHAHEATSEVEHEHQQGSLSAYLGKFHPVIVHFPIGLIITALLAEILFMFTSVRGFENASKFMLPVGAAGAIVAVILGWLAAANANYPQPLAEILQDHRWWGIGTTIVAVVAAALQRLSVGNPKLLWFYRAALLVAVLLVAQTGHLGGMLVFGVDYFTF